MDMAHGYGLDMMLCVYYGYGYGLELNRVPGYSSEDFASEEMLLLLLQILLLAAFLVLFA